MIAIFHDISVAYRIAFCKPTICADSYSELVGTHLPVDTLMAESVLEKCML